MILRRLNPILRTACSIEVTGADVLKKTVFARLKRRVVNDGSFSIKSARSFMEVLSPDASSISFVVTTDKEGREYPELSLSKMSLNASSDIFQTGQSINITPSPHGQTAWSLLQPFLPLLCLCQQCHGGCQDYEGAHFVLSI